MQPVILTADVFHFVHAFLFSVTAVLLLLPLLLVSPVSTILRIKNRPSVI